MSQHAAQRLVSAGGAGLGLAGAATAVAGPLRDGPSLLSFCCPGTPCKPRPRSLRNSRSLTRAPDVGVFSNGVHMGRKSSSGAPWCWPTTPGHGALCVRGSAPGRRPVCREGLASAEPEEGGAERRKSLWTFVLGLGGTPPALTELWRAAWALHLLQMDRLGTCHEYTRFQSTPRPEGALREGKSEQSCR